MCRNYAHRAGLGSVVEQDVQVVQVPDVFLKAGYYLRFPPVDPSSAAVLKHH